MKQLSGIDATFLYLETEQTPMHVAGLTLYELPEGFEGSFHAHFKTFFAGRVHLIPIFSKKLARTVLQLDHPGWVEAGTPDLDYHILSATLPKPGTRAQLEALVGELHSQPLDRSRPLWQFTVIEGLEDGQVALYSKVHHAAIDGGAGMVITQALYDLGPVPREVDVPEPPMPEEKPGIPERAVLGLHDMMTGLVRQQLKMMEALPGVMTRMFEIGAAAVANPGSLPALQLIAPKTPFNRTMGRGRTYAARSIPLADCKAIAKATGTKLNDVVMAICSGALRAYLSDKHALPDAPLIAFVPISIREAGNTDLNNQVFGMNTPLATNYKDPLKRLRKIFEESTQTKTAAGAVQSMAPQDFTLIGAPFLIPGLVQLAGRMGLPDVMPSAVNVCISNTAGPPFPLYCAGAKVTALYPVSIATHGVGLNFTVQSYLGKLDFGLTAGAKAVPDIGSLGDMLIASFEELRAAALPEPEKSEAAEPAEKPAEKPAAKAERKEKPAKAKPAAKTKPVKPGSKTVRKSKPRRKTPAKAAAAKQ